MHAELGGRNKINNFNTVEHNLKPHIQRLLKNQFFK